MITDNKEYAKMPVIVTIIVIISSIYKLDDLEISEQICCTSFDR